MQNVSATEKRRLLRHALRLALLVIERYGLDGKRPRSVGEISEKYGWTREEVRYIEARIVGALKAVADLSDGPKLATKVKDVCGSQSPGLTGSLWPCLLIKGHAGKHQWEDVS